MSEQTYYFIEEKEKKKGGGVPRQRIASHLRDVYEKHGTHFDDVEHFTEELVENEGMQRLIGVSVRVASEKDLKSFEEDMHIFEALEEITNAEAIMKAKVANAQRVVLEHVKDFTIPDEYELFMATHRLRKDTIMHWARKQKDEIRLPQESIDAWSAYMMTKEKPNTTTNAKRIAGAFYN